MEVDGSGDCWDAEVLDGERYKQMWMKRTDTGC